MAHSRETEHYQLPLYNGTDIINPLTDFNNANEKIDVVLYDANENSAEAKAAAEAAAQSISQYDARITAAVEAADSAVIVAENTKKMMAEEFNPLKDGGYQIGDIVVYQNKLWEFINPHSGAWDASDVKVTVIGDALQDTIDDAKAEIAQEVADALDVISQQTEKVTKTQEMIAPAFDPNKQNGYDAKAIVTYADKLYMFNAHHDGVWTGTDVTQITLTEFLVIIMQEV